MSRPRYTPEQEAIIREHFPHRFTRDIAAMIGRTEQATAQKASDMGIKKTPEFLKANCRIQPGQHTGNQFQKGHTPANKGKRQTTFLSPEKIERTKPNRFQKGHRPKHTKENGTITARRKSGTSQSYKFIRLGPRNWKLLHVYLWEQVNGTLPPGQMLTFKNGDTLDCRLENLELITRAANVLRNSGSLSLSDGFIAKCLSGKNPELQKHIKANHPELIKTARINYELNRKIKEYEGN